MKTPTGHENEGSIGVVIDPVAAGRPAPERAGNIDASQRSDLATKIMRSSRFVPASRSGRRKGLEATVRIDDDEIDSSGRKIEGTFRISIEGVRLGGGRVAQMNERPKLTLDAGDEERQMADLIGDAATPLFRKFFLECDKRF